MNSPAIPLLRHESPDAIVAYREGRPIAARAFLAAAAALGSHLPPGRHVLNVCRDRYQFTVGLAACLTTGRISLLPSTHTPEVIRRLTDFAPDVFCLTDESDCNIELPRHLLQRAPGAAENCNEVPWRVPHIPADQTAAIVFTSGSTGVPLPHAKTWGTLARCVRDGAPRLGVFGGAPRGGPPLTLVGTVPAQHMYGFESTVLLALQSGGAFAAERPFYPADIAAAVAALPRPRALVSTPLHLRALLAADLAAPPLDLIVSATAPLAVELARQLEAAFGASVMEIYGSTETGQIATRRTAESGAWRLWPGVRLTAREGQAYAHGGHVERSTPLCDLVDILDEHTFHLLGRTADLVNVAGKRSSLAYLTAQLNAIPGVVDGAFFLPAPDPAVPADVVRVAAAAVAPALGKAELLSRLRQRIDPAFLPRPLLLVDALPRNATGKLPQHALQTLAARRAAGPRGAATGGCGDEHAAAVVVIAAGHPAFAGHFPGSPVLPGAVLLDEVLCEIERSRGIDLTRWRITAAKFLGRVLPGDELVVRHSASESGAIRFTIGGPRGPVATGSLVDAG